MHTSIKLETPCELINVTPLNPLISKCQIKVCYVGDMPNRNRTVITKDVAKEIANSLPGSPIVGFYNETNEDFEEHNKVIDISNGKFEFKDTTRPYGFVDLNAKVWFQKYQDDGVEHEYLVTEGYLWTGQYPEAKRIIAHGNNQSMELDGNYINGHWAEDSNGEPQFFIINEAIISKLCILGEDVEPCFEGANITNVQFSFDDTFVERWNSIVEQVNDLFIKGGQTVATKKNSKDPVLENSLVDENGNPIDAAAADDEDKNLNPEAEGAEGAPAAAEEGAEPAADDNAEGADDNAGAEGADDSASEDDDAANDDEGAEGEDGGEPAPAAEPTVDFAEENATLKAENEELKAQLAELVEFKNGIERQQKEAMIDSFYMLSDEDKKEVVENIDNYSLDDIEAKLSIICVRNKVSFDLDDNKEDGTAPKVYNLNSSNSEDEDLTPAWLKAVQSVAKNKR